MTKETKEIYDKMFDIFELARRRERILICGGVARDYYLNKEYDLNIVPRDLDIISNLTEEDLKKLQKDNVISNLNFMGGDVYTFTFRGINVDMKHYDVLDTDAINDSYEERDLNINGIFIERYQTSIIPISIGHGSYFVTIDEVADGQMLADPIRILKAKLLIKRLRDVGVPLRVSKTLRDLFDNMNENLSTQSKTRIRKTYEKGDLTTKEIVLKPGEFKKKNISFIKNDRQNFYNIILDISEGAFNWDYKTAWNEIDIVKWNKEYNVMFTIKRGFLDSSKLIGEINKLPDLDHPKGHVESVKQHIQMCVNNSKGKSKEFRKLVAVHDLGKLICGLIRTHDEKVFGGHEKYSSFVALFDCNKNMKINYNLISNTLNHMKREPGMEEFDELDLSSRIIKVSK